MPQKKSAAKAHRKSLKEYARNAALRKKIKDLRKKAIKTITEKNKEAAMTVYRELQKVVDKAAKRGHFLNKNTAGRYKTRLMAKINALGKN